MDRRRFLSAVAGAGVALAAPSARPALAQGGDPIVDGRPLVRYPEKTDLTEYLTTTYGPGR